MSGESNMSHKEFMKNYRLGQSKSYLKYDPKDNYPDYSKHGCMVKRHLTLEVSHLSLSFYRYILLNSVLRVSQHKKEIKSRHV